jgi:hypothetical protein
MAFDTEIKSPVLSPVTNEYSEAQITDENNKTLDLVAFVAIDSNGHTNLGAVPYSSSGHKSSVTALQQGSVVTTPAGEKIRLFAACSLDSAGNPIAFAAAAAAKVTGKFQSAVTVGSGASQSIAHGLGVVPSLVLVAPYDNTASGSTPFTFQIAEGVHTSTNLLITATSGLKYKVIAFA